MTTPALTGVPLSKGSYSWGGAASTFFWVDREQEIAGLVLTQVVPVDRPLRQLMQQLTYQAIVR